MIPLPRCQVALGLVVAGLALSACGGDDEPAGATNTGGGPTASAPAATAPPPDATGPLTTPTQTQTQTAPDNGGAGAGGAGSGGAAPGEAPDEQEVRVPASFVVAAGRLEPSQITVPPLLAVEVSIRADDGRAHRLELRTPQPQVLEVAAGRRAAVRIDGLRAGTYPVLLDGREAGAIVAGGEVGP